MTATAGTDGTTGAPGGGPAEGASASWFGDAVFVLAVVVLAAFAVWRATLGIDYLDGAHYTAVALRLAQGARPFADEMSLQVTGFLLPAAFAKLWTAAFGLTGLHLALRLFYVALAACVAAVVYGALQPTFGRWGSLAAAVVPLLAPPYNVIGPSYNTLAILGFMAATALAFAAVRDRNGRAAGAAGFALAFGAVSYPPFVIGAAMAGAAYLLVARDRRLALWFLGGGLSLAAAVLVYLFAVTSVGGLRTTFAYVHAWGGAVQGPLAKFAAQARFMREPFVRRNAWPMWALAVVALLPLPWRKLRAGALALVPLAAGVPALLRYSPPSQGYVGIVPAVMLITFSAVVALPLLVWAVAEHRRDVLILLALAAPVGLVDFALALYSSNAGYHRGAPFTGLAPLAMALVAGWSLFVGTLGGKRLVAGAAASFLALTAIMLCATVYRDGIPNRLTVRIPTGVFAGILTTPRRAADVEAMQAAGRRWVRAGDPVLAVGGPGGYLLVGGRIDTNCVWLWDGPSDRFALRYFAEHKDPPRVVIVADDPAATPVSANDPLRVWLAQEYREAESDGGFRLYVRP